MIAIVALMFITLVFWWVALSQEGGDNDDDI